MIEVVTVEAVRLFHDSVHRCEWSTRSTSKRNYDANRLLKQSYQAPMTEGSKHHSTFQSEGLRLNLKAFRLRGERADSLDSGDHGHRDAGQETCIEVPSARNVSKGLQEFN